MKNITDLSSETLNSGSARKFELTAQTLMLLFATGFIVWLIWHSFYAVAQADDFCFGSYGDKHGALNAVISWYENWAGNYPAVFLTVLLTQSKWLMVDHIYIVPLIFLSVFIFFFYYSFSKILIGRFNFQQIGFLTVLFTVYMLFYPKNQVLYWVTGVVFYGIAVILMLWMITEEISIFTDKVNPTKIKFFLILAGSFIVPGFGATMWVAYLSMLLPICAYSILKKEKSSVWIWITVSVILGGLIMYVAPGNSVRMSTFHFERNFFYAAIKSFVLLIQHVPIALGMIILWFSVLVGFLNYFPINNIASRSLKFTPFLFLGIWGSVFARVYSTGGFGPGRTRAIDYVLLNLLTLIIACYLLNKYKIKLMEIRKKYLIGIILAFVILTVGVLITPLGNFEIERIRSAVNLKKGLNNRYYYLMNSNEKNVVVDEIPLSKKPVTLFADIVEGKSDFKNICTADYFNLESVELKANTR